MALTAWGDRWNPPPAGVAVRFRHRVCGRTFQAQVSCSECGERIRTADVIPTLGPGGASAPGTRLLPERIRELARLRRHGTSSRAR